MPTGSYEGVVDEGDGSSCPMCGERERDICRGSRRCLRAAHSYSGVTVHSVVYEGRSPTVISRCPSSPNHSKTHPKKKAGWSPIVIHGSDLDSPITLSCSSITSSRNETNQLYLSERSRLSLRPTRNQGVGFDTMFWKRVSSIGATLLHFQQP